MSGSAGSRVCPLPAGCLGASLAMWAQLTEGETGKAEQQVSRTKGVNHRVLSHEGSRVQNLRAAQVTHEGLGASTFRYLYCIHNKHPRCIPLPMDRPGKQKFKEVMATAATRGRGRPALSDTPPAGALKVRAMSALPKDSHKAAHNHL